MSASRTFARSFEAIEDLFAFTAEAFALEGIDPALRPPIDLILEELFTNVVKYGHSCHAEVRVDLTGVPGGVEVTITEDDAERFDPTAVPEVDTSKPLEERTPGGLGIHLVRKLVDSIEYRYMEESRQARTTFRKTLAKAEQ